MLKELLEKLEALEEELRNDNEGSKTEYLTEEIKDVQYDIMFELEKTIDDLGIECSRSKQTESIYIKYISQYDPDDIENSDVGQIRISLHNNNYYSEEDYILNTYEDLIEKALEITKRQDVVDYNNL